MAVRHAAGWQKAPQTHRTRAAGKVSGRRLAQQPRFLPAAQDLRLRRNVWYCVAGKNHAFCRRVRTRAPPQLFAANRLGEDVPIRRRPAFRQVDDLAAADRGGIEIQPDVHMRGRVPSEAIL